MPYKIVEVVAQHEKVSRQLKLGGKRGSVGVSEQMSGLSLAACTRNPRKGPKTQKKSFQAQAHTIGVPAAMRSNPA